MSQTAEQLKDQLSAMSVTRHGWSPRRSGNHEENRAFASAIESDESCTGTWKRVIDEGMAEWQALQTALHYVKWYWDSNTFPYVYRGVRLFHRDRRSELLDELRKCDARLKELAAALDAKRPSIMEWAKAKFPKTFDASVYPDRFRDAFGVSWAEHNIEPPKYLERDDAEEYKRELQKSLVNIGASMQQFERQCYHRMGEVAAALAQNLGKKGNQGIGDNVRGMVELFDRVHQMRFEGTASFQKCLREAKALIDGVELAELKRPGGVREDVRKRLEALIEKHKKLKEVIVEKAK